jgi:hypothetical protein
VIKPFGIILEVLKAVSNWFTVMCSSVVDPELFIIDPDPTFQGVPDLDPLFKKFM